MITALHPSSGSKMSEEGMIEEAMEMGVVIQVVPLDGFLLLEAASLARDTLKTVEATTDMINNNHDMEVVVEEAVTTLENLNHLTIMMVTGLDPNTGRDSHVTMVTTQILITIRKAIVL